MFTNTITTPNYTSHWMFWILVENQSVTYVCKCWPHYLHVCFLLFIQGVSVTYWLVYLNISWPIALHSTWKPPNHPPPHYSLYSFFCPFHFSWLKLSLCIEIREAETCLYEEVAFKASEPSYTHKNTHKNHHHHLCFMDLFVSQLSLCVYLSNLLLK